LWNPSATLLPNGCSWCLHICFRIFARQRFRTGEAVVWLNGRQKKRSDEKDKGIENNATSQFRGEGNLRRSFQFGRLIRRRYRDNQNDNICQPLILYCSWAELPEWKCATVSQRLNHPRLLFGHSAKHPHAANLLLAIMPLSACHDGKYGTVRYSTCVRRYRYHTIGTVPYRTVPYRTVQSQIHLDLPLDVPEIE
jgi:hypothetical protein